MEPAKILRISYFNGRTKGARITVPYGDVRNLVERLRFVADFGDAYRHFAKTGEGYTMPLESGAHLEAKLQGVKGKSASISFLYASSEGHRLMLKAERILGIHL